MGRYSIILLCTHHMIYRPVKVVLSHLNCDETYFTIFVSIVTLLLSTALIPVCKKYIPCFTAQKDLIKIPQNNG